MSTPLKLCCFFIAHLIKLINTIYFEAFTEFRDTALYLRTWFNEKVNSMLVLMLTNKKKKQLRLNYRNNDNFESIILSRVNWFGVLYTFLFEPILIVRKFSKQPLTFTLLAGKLGAGNWSNECSIKEGKIFFLPQESIQRIVNVNLSVIIKSFTFFEFGYKRHWRENVEQTNLDKIRELSHVDWHTSAVVRMCCFYVFRNNNDWKVMNSRTTFMR